jgi:hypothetical protein
MYAIANPGGVSAHITPFAYHHYAKDFLHAGISLGVQSDFSPVQYHLFGHAVELALKAFLLTCSMTVPELRGRKYGHKLHELLNKSVQQRLLDHVALTPEQCNEIRLAEKYYWANGDRVFEYPKIIEALKGYPDKPNPIVLGQAAQLLVAKLESLVR